MAKAPVAFLLSAPRSGSTLLLRMLHAHPAIQGLAEPHLVHPLQALRATALHPAMKPQACRGISSFLRSLPEGEEAQIQALRAYLDTLYGNALSHSPTGTRWLIDKTPANATASHFIRELYPDAPLIILRRHPAAIAWSQAQAFFGGDLQRARLERPILIETIPALAPALRGELGTCLVLDHEQIVQTPHAELLRIFEALDLPDCPDAVEYGQVPLRGPGDPVEVDRHSRPVASLAQRWESSFAENRAYRAEVEAQLEQVSDADLRAWGWPRDQLWTSLRGVSSGETAHRARPYTVGRTALMWIRKDIEHRPHGRLILKLRGLCSLLLGEHRGS